MSIPTILLVIALVLALVAFLPNQERYPWLSVAVICVCISLLWGALN